MPDLPGVLDGANLPRAKFPGGEYVTLFPLIGGAVTLIWVNDDNRDPLAWQKCPAKYGYVLVYQRLTGWQAKGYV